MKSSLLLTTHTYVIVCVPRIVAFTDHNIDTITFSIFTYDWFGTLNLSASRTLKLGFADALSLRHKYLSFITLQGVTGKED